MTHHPTDLHPGILHAQDGAGMSMLCTAEGMINSYALRLNGTSQYLYAPDSARLSLLGDMTTELWVRFHSLPTAGNRMTLTAKWLQSGVAPNNRSWSLFLFNDGGTLKLEFGANDLGTSVANAVVSWPWTPIVGTWYHVAHTYDISQVQAAESVAYINGVDQGAATIEVARNISGIYDGIARFGVGSWDHAQQGGLLAADISNVRLWSVTRTQGEIQGYLYQFLTGSETGLVEDWRLANDYTSNASGGTTLISVGPPSFITEVPF